MARIDVLTSRPIGPVDRRIFGSFTEHLGRCVYGGLFDEGSPLSGPDGFRTDVLGAVRDLGVTNVRWPGGNFVSGYHWADGIGPDRPRRPELAWHSEESNRFGTAEFLAWSAAAGVEPVLCLNMGTGTLDEALAWVEYCNGAGDTYWAARRRANGRAEPYGVRYWGLGNEMYGDWQLGQRTAAEYVTEARRWAKALKRLDPGIRLVSCGQTGLDDWDRVVIDGPARYVDFHSIHLYTGSADYWSNVLAPHYAERALSVAGALIDRARYVQRIEHEIFVAYDEWNVWYRTDDGRLEERYNLADALAAATYLNVFVRQCWTVRMANLAQLVNVIAPIVTSPEGLFTQSIYHPFRLMATASLPVALDTWTDSGTHAHRDRTADRWPYRVADLGLFQLLDVAATADPERSRLTLSVVNRDPDRAVQTRIRLHDARATGVMTVHEVTGAGPADLQSTILTWGNPYYTKLSLAIRSGSPPDVAIMHLSRITEFGPPGMLTPLINTYWALVLPQVPAPIAVFIFKKFFDGIPISLEQAAEVDGAGWWTSYRRIALPLARPAIAAVSIFTFVWTSNNFLWPFLAATSQTMMTIPAGIGTVVSGVGIVNALHMASAVLGALPLVFVFLVAQRQIVEGVAGTGLK